MVEGERTLMQILPQRVVFDQPWFGICARPEDLLVSLSAESVGVAVAVDVDDPQVALIQTEATTAAGPTMVMVFIDWKILRPESTPGMPGARARFDLDLGGEE